MPRESNEPVGGIEADATEMPCPRCAYDQRGAYSSQGGDSSAPATCSECGLVFTWADVTQPERINLRGFVEHSTGWTSTWLAALRTTLWAVWPPVFYARVRMEHRIVPRRWAAWAGWVLLPPVAIVLMGFAVWLAAIWLIATLRGTSSGVMYWLNIYWSLIESIALAQLSYGSRLTFGAALPLIWAVTAVAMSVIAFVASGSLGRMRVRRELIWRAVAYSFAPALICVLAQLADSTARPILWLTNPVAARKTSWIEVLLGPTVVNSMSMGWIRLAIVLLGVVWCGAWWAVTMRRGWRIDSRWTVAKICIAQCVIAFLSILLAAASLGQ